MNREQPKGKFNKIKALSDKKIFEGLKFSYENSKELFNSALILKRNKKFGVAHSLLILSIEELIKASSLLNILISGSSEIELSRGIFEAKNLHINKHKFALFINEYLKLINFKKLMKADFDFKNPDIFSSILLAEIDYKKIFKNIDIEKARINNWFNEANNKKNIGLYVDFNGSWCTPKRIDETDLIIAIKETKIIRNIFFELFELLSIQDEKQFKLVINIIRKTLESLIEKDKMNG